MNKQKYIKYIKQDYSKKLAKPRWMKIKLPVDYTNIKHIKSILRKNSLHSVCEEASCPNITECFNRKTATFMILGDTCTRRCPFCNVNSGRPVQPDINEPINLAKAIFKMKLNYVVITSVNRDDLHDGGVQHFANCINAIRKFNPYIKIEILSPDFRGCMDNALNVLHHNPPNVFNHNLESVPRIYKIIRPGANYNTSLKFLRLFKERNADVPTKSGIMVGLGESNNEIIEVMRDLFDNGVTILTIGQYLQPSEHHFPVQRYLSNKDFLKIKNYALQIGFSNVNCGPLVRSSYHADVQAKYALHNIN